VTALDALLRLHEGLPRQAPGSDAATRAALARVRPRLPAAPRVADLGCGPGRSALVLAAALGVPVVAVDRHRPFLDQLAAAAGARGLRALVEPREADLETVAFDPESLDLIWAEGVAYVFGFADSLRRWRPWLAPGGVVALTECSWLTEAPAPAAARFWAEAYPAMATVAGNLARAREAGLAPIDTSVLPPEAWWDEYYGPLQVRLDAFRPGADADLAAAIAAAEAEIECYRRHGDHYGYVFYLLAAGAGSRHPRDSGMMYAVDGPGGDARKPAVRVHAPEQLSPVPSLAAVRASARPAGARG
jgi:serine/threonine-protein kinase HipA